MKGAENVKIPNFKLRNISIRTIIISTFILSLLIVILTVGYIVFENWMSEAEHTVSVIANDLNKDMINEVTRYMHVPKHMNEVNKRLLENGIINLEDTEERENFFVNAMQSHNDEEVYSFSIGLATGEYYGARKNKSNAIEIMRNNRETSGVSRYYSVTEDNTAGELAVFAGKFDPRTRAWYKTAIKEGSYVFSPIYKHFVLDDLTVSAAVPIYDESKNLIGVLGAHTVLSRINNYLNGLASDKNAYTVIIERDTGDLIANSLEIENYKQSDQGSYNRLNIMEIDNQILKETYQNYEATPQNSINITVDDKDYHSNISRFQLDGLDWLVISVIPESFLSLEIINSIKTALFLSVLAILVLSLLYFMITYYMLKPVNDLVAIQERFAAGNLKERASHEGEIKEIKVLSRGFNKMAETVDQLVNNLEHEVDKRTIKISERNDEIKKNKEQLQLILDSTVEGICGIDQSGICTFINKSAVEMLGYNKPEELIGTKIHDIFHHSYSDGHMMPINECQIYQALKAGKSIHVNDEVFWKKDWKSFDVQYYTHPQIVNDTLIGSVITFLDFTERKKMEQMVYNEKEQFRTTLLSVGDAVISTDSHGKIQVMNPVAEELTGWDQKEAQGKYIEDVFHIVNETTRDRCENPVHRVLERNDIIELNNHTLLIRKDGSEIPIEDSAAPIKNNKGYVTGVVIVFRDFSDKKERLEEIEYLSFHDHLTGLYNRRYISDAMKRLDTKRNLPFSLMALDVNGLKLTNDAFGHEVGDKLLIHVAELLKKVCREEDIVGRMGGDEFIVLLPQTSEEEANRIKSRIVEKTKEEKFDSVIVSLAIGTSTKKNNNTSIHEVLKVADNNMYNDKLKYGKIMRSKTIETVIENIQKKYDQEEVHTERVSQYSAAIAKAMGFDKKEIEKIKMAGILHDIGKIIVPPEILNKSQVLSKNEFEVIKRHSETSYQILKSVEEYSDFAEDVLYHHERIDGKGYPEGLAGDEIPINSRIIAVADAYEAMTSERPYHKGMSKEDAINELLRCSGTQFDTNIVKIFINEVL